MAMSCVALVGASTAAPRLHQYYLKTLSTSYVAPVVIVQHMPCGPFIDGLVGHLASVVRTRVALAEHGQRPRCGEVYVVKPGTALGFAADGSFRVAPEPHDVRITPRMDITFASAARVFGPRAAAAMCSGLHAQIDGLEGCRAIRRAGGRVLVTTPNTTPCYTMVQQVIDAGEYDAETRLEAILGQLGLWLGGQQ